MSSTEPEAASSSSPQRESTHDKQYRYGDGRNRPVVVEKIIQQPTYVEKIVEVPVIKYVDVPREVIQYVPKVEVKIVEQEVPVPGPIIEVPKPVVKEITKTIYDYVDHEQPTTVAVTMKPTVQASKEHKKVVRVKKYVPYMVPVEVYIPVPVNRDLIVGDCKETTRSVQMPPSQFNAQVKAANPGLSEEHLASLYQRFADGSIPMFKGPGTSVVPPNVAPAPTN